MEVHETSCSLRTLTSGFAEFQAAINEVIDGLSTTHADSLESLMTLNFQRFEDVSLMAA